MIDITLEKSIVFISSFGTIISALAALYAIRLTIFQRRLSYKPNLVIDDLNLNMKVKDFSGFTTKILEESNTPRINFLNVGLGAAISIKYHWDFDYKKNINSYLKLFLQQYQKEDKSITFELKNNFLEVKKEKSSTFFNTQLKPNEINFSLPYNIEKEPKDIIIPNPAIIILLNIAYVSFSSRPLKLKSFNGPRLVIEYKNIEGKTSSVFWDTILEVRSASFSANDMEAIFALRFTPARQRWTKIRP